MTEIGMRRKENDTNRREEEGEEKKMENVYHGDMINCML